MNMVIKYFKKQTFTPIACLHVYTCVSKCCINKIKITILTDINHLHTKEKIS